MPDYATMGRGKSWECASSAHGGCQLTGCVCPCHYTIGAEDEMKRELVQNDAVKVPNPPSAVVAPQGLFCPKCGTQARNGDRFCRKDGTQLEAPHCTSCGQKIDPSDLYCANCGHPTTEEIQLRSTG